MVWLELCASRLACCRAFKSCMRFSASSTQHRADLLRQLRGVRPLQKVVGKTRGSSKLAYEGGRRLALDVRERQCVERNGRIAGRSDRWRICGDRTSLLPRCRPRWLAALAGAASGLGPQAAVVSAPADGGASAQYMSGDVGAGTDLVEGGAGKSAAGWNGSGTSADQSKKSG